MEPEVLTKSEVVDDNETPQIDAPAAERIRVLRVPLDIAREDELDAIIWRLLNQHTSHNIVLLSLLDLMRARRNKEYRPFVQNASLVIPISRSIQGGAKFLTGKYVPRYMPFDFIIRLLTILERQEGTVYLLGGKSGILRTTEKKLRSTFPGLRIVGRFPANFKKNDENLIVEAIRKAAPSLLLVARGVRGREKWLARHSNELNPGLRLWCSDIYEIFSDRKARPGTFIFKRGLEWVGFCLRNPLRLFRFLPFIHFKFLLLVYKIFRLDKKNKF